jgi:hypothetical protein
VVVATAAVLLVVTQFTSYTHHFHAHLAKHRILRSLQEHPALRLTFQLKRKAMYVHGASTFDVLATPMPRSDSDGSRVVYNGFASFEEDGDRHEYSLVDGTAFYVRYPGGTSSGKAESGCLPSHFVPPIETVLSAIQGATTATHLVKSDVDDRCPGSVMMFPFAGEDFVLCSRRSSSPWFQDDGFQIFGSDLNINVKFVDSAPEVLAPRVPSDVAAACGKVPFGERITPSLPSVLTRSALEWGHRSLRAEEAEFSFKTIFQKITGDDSACTCKGERRVCVFVAGLRSYKDHGMTEDDPTNYFGKSIPDHAPCCSSIKYITLATQLNAWNNAVFQERLVGLLLQASPTSDKATKTIKDTIVVTHSMGNLMLGGAIASGLTTVDSSSTWVGTSGPLEGSMGSNYLYETCDGALTKVVAKVLDLLGNCPPEAGRASLVYQGSNYSSPKLDGDFTVAQAAYASNISAVLCSTNHIGLTTIQGAIFSLAAKVIPHRSLQNDGVVEYQSCAKGLAVEQFGDTSSSSFYVTGLNHVDTSFRNGDSLFNDNRRPVKWFECLL